MRRLKFFLSVLALLLLLAPAPLLAKQWMKASTTGGTSADLDSLTCVGKNSLSWAFVIESGSILMYTYNSTGSDSEDSPDIVVPDDRVANCAGQGQWELITSIPLAPSSNPGTTYIDADTDDHDPSARIAVNCTDTSTGTEDCDIYITSQINGNDISANPPATWLIHFDADGYMNVSKDINLSTGQTIRVNGAANWITWSNVSADNAPSDGDVPTFDETGNNTVWLTPSGTGVPMFDTDPIVSGDMTFVDGGTIRLSDNNFISFDITADGMDDDEFNGETLLGRDCGENLAQWDLVRLANDSDPWHQADADAAGEFPAIGIAVEACTDTNAVTILVKGVVRNEGWTGLTPGGAVYLSDTAGGITQTAPADSGDCVQVVGWALSDSEIYFDFSRPYLELE